MGRRYFFEITCLPRLLCLPVHTYAWPGLAWPGLAWPGLSPGLAWPGLAWPGLAWPGLAWPGLAWPGLAWPGLAWPGLRPGWSYHRKNNTCWISHEILETIEPARCVYAPWWTERWMYCRVRQRRCQNCLKLGLIYDMLKGMM
jgi:hypothetical protein